MPLHDSLPRPTPAERRRAEDRPLATRVALSADHADLIDQSHERCKALGLSRITRPDLSPLASSDMRLVRERNRRLFTHAAPLMEMLYEQISGTESMVVLTDAQGTILHSIGDDDFLARASKVALQPGANWAEHTKGTNAIGTALVDESPMLVHADEHFMHANHFLTCSASPIMDPGGSILGVLDVTGDHRSYHHHTLALVKMSARMIENQWLSDDLQQSLRLHFHTRASYLGTLMEGIVAVAADGRIVGVNRAALDLLGLSGAALRMQGLQAVFGLGVGELVDRFRSPLATPLTVHDTRGQAFQLIARFNWPVWTHVIDAAAAAAPVIEAVAHGLPSAAADDALQALACEDTRLGAHLAQVRRAASSGVPLLLVGPTGSGKSLLAQAVHAASGRASKPFVVLDGTLGDDEVEAWFAAGGPIEGAQGGTVVVDDVDALSPRMQLRLLQWLRRQESAAPTRAVAWVATTAVDLRAMARAGDWRADLLHRLGGLVVELPALADRDDLTALARRLLEREPRRPPLRLSGEVLRLFGAHPWPGNLRQLRHVLEAAAALAGPDGSWIALEHLPAAFVAEARAAMAAAGADDPGAAGSGPATGPVSSLEATTLETIERAVADCQGNISAAAKRLGVSRNTIYRKLRRQRDGAA